MIRTKDILSGCNKRNKSLDIARIVAMLSVIMIHVSAVFISGYEHTDSFIVGNIFDSVSRAAVPLFLMVSGALLLSESKEKSVLDMLKSIKQIILLFVVWSIIYSIIFNVIAKIVQGENISVTSFIKSAVTGHYHMWYLLMLVGIYLITPFLKQFVKKENKNLVLLYIGVSACTTFCKPIINVISSYFDAASFINTFINKFYLDFFAGFVTYYLVGWYIVHVGISNKILRKFIYFLGGISVLSIIIITQITKDYINMYSDTNIFVFIYSTSIFLLINNSSKVDSFSEKATNILSKLSFGIYIIHPMIDKFFGFALSAVENVWIHIVLRFITVFSVSLIVSYLISKIPYIKKILRI